MCRHCDRDSAGEIRGNVYDCEGYGDKLKLKKTPFNLCREKFQEILEEI